MHIRTINIEEQQSPSTQKKGEAPEGPSPLA